MASMAPAPVQANGTPLIRPPLQRRNSSVLSIEHGDFEWLKQYFRPEPEEVLATALPAAPMPRAGQKHRHSDEAPLGGLPALSPMKHEGHEEDDMDDGGFKRRRKIGWTNTEDLTILAAVRRVGTQWQRIADNLPGRTADAVRNRWHRLQRTHALSDTDEGRSALDGLLVASGIDVDWCPPDLVGLADTGAAATATGAAEPCIRGSDHGRQMWTPEEDQIIRDGVARFGCKWRQIASLLTGRTDSSVRNRWMRLCRENGRENSVRENSARDSLTEALSPLAATALPLLEKEQQQQQQDAVGGAPSHTAPAVVLQSSQEMILDELSQTLKSSLEVDKLPLGLEAPTMVLDLDSFAEAVSNCVAGGDVDGPYNPSDMPRFEAFDAPLFHAAPRSRVKPASSASVDVPDAEAHWAPINLKLASAALATVTAVTIASSVAMRRR